MNHSKNPKHDRSCSCSRRHFIAGSSAAVSASLLSACGVKTTDINTSTAEVSNDILLPLSREVRDALSPEQIIQRAKEGNQRFRTGRKRNRDFLVEMRTTAAGQHPAAVVLSCIDSRAPAEIIFDLGLGDIFNCRVAGNIDNPDILGSMEFATKLSGAKIVCVLGHSACGAIKGAIADAQLGNLTQLLSKIHPAIEATQYSGNRSADNDEFVDAVARKNVELTFANIRERSPIIADLEKNRAVKVFGGFYDITTGAVEFLF
ncbi:MAG: carbonic anhydrase [Methylomicrobium sp.]|nr:carbonic anhydrase [Methylomicrobium sp.]